MADALNSGKVGGYAYDTEDPYNTPLWSAKNSYGSYPFSSNTKEAMRNRSEIIVKNLTALVSGKPINIVSKSNL